MQVRALVVTALLLLVAGCGSDPAGSAATSVTTSPPAPSTSAPLTSASHPSASATSSAPITTVMGRRCGRPDVEADVTQVSGPDGQRLTLSSVGGGTTVALLLHQTNASASCGWWPFANRLAQNGVRAVMLDFCGYGPSSCDPTTPWGSDYVDQAVRAVAQLRSHGATRVTLVGASLGGTVASVSAAPAGVDAVVNLSGFGFGPLVTAPSIAALTIPILGAGGHDEQSDSAALEAMVASSASPARRFVWADVGHGWSLVLDGPRYDDPVSAVGRTVIAWTQGRYSD